MDRDSGEYASKRCEIPDVYQNDHWVVEDHGDEMLCRSKSPKSYADKAWMGSAFDLLDTCIAQRSTMMARPRVAIDMKGVESAHSSIYGFATRLKQNRSLPEPVELRNRSDELRKALDLGFRNGSWACRIFKDTLAEENEKVRLVSG